MGQSQPSPHPVESQPRQQDSQPFQTNGTPNQLLQSTLIQKFGNLKLIPSKEDVKSLPSSLVELFTSNSCKSYPFNQENCSIYERELPNEIFIYILRFLNNREIIRLGRVCSNFKYYWIENENVWSGRLLEMDGIELFMYFKPIRQTPIQTIVYYHEYFLPNIVNSFQQKNRSDIRSLDMICKMAILGPKQCGKSQLFKSILGVSSREFDSSYEPTIGAQYGGAVYQNNNDEVIMLHVWDYSGQQNHSIVRAFTVDAMVVTFCFDINDFQSFVEMKERIKRFQENFTQIKFDFNESLRHENKSLLIIGLKRDLERNVTRDEVGEYLLKLVPNSKDGIFMKDLRVQYFELSNKMDTKQSLGIPFVYGMIMEEELMIGRTLKKA